jgi:hypothetical protein
MARKDLAMGRVQTGWTKCQFVDVRFWTVIRRRSGLRRMRPVLYEAMAAEEKRDWSIFTGCTAD